MEHDVIVIGSGAGGAPIAHRLAAAGKSVLLLEKGPMAHSSWENLTTSGAFGSERILDVQGVTNTGAAYYPSRWQPDLNDEPHIYKDHLGLDRATTEGYTAQVIGGGTHVYGGVSVRLCEHDFRLKSLNKGRKDLIGPRVEEVLGEARDWPISYQDLAPFYEEAETLLGIHGTQAGQARPLADDTYGTPPAPHPASQFISDGMDELGFARYRTPLAEKIQDGKRQRSDVWSRLLAPLVGSTKLRIRPNCAVTHLEAQQDKVTRVHYLGPTGIARWAKAEVVILACSAIESVRLLQISGQRDGNFALRANFNDLLGRYFMTQIVGGAEVRLRDRIDPSGMPWSTWATDHCTRPEFFRAQGIWAGGLIYDHLPSPFPPIELLRDDHLDQQEPWLYFLNQDSAQGETLRRIFDKGLGRQMALTFVANQVPQPTNRIRLHTRIRDKWGLPVAYVDRDWHGHDLAVMQVMSDVCRNILETGARKHGGHEELRVIQDGSRVTQHVLGGARFGSRQTHSVLDPSCKLWRFQNLYITDGAFMPTTGSVNPTLTIQANALRVANIILTEGRI